MKKVENFSLDYAGRKLSVEIGKLAHQADAAAKISYGETTVLVTVVSEKKPREGYMNFLPLTVEYREKMYASGRIPGSKFVKREGRPSDEAILVGRLIDRSIRPLFPKGYHNDTQVVIYVLSYDGENSTYLPALVGSALVLGISDIPFNGPVSITSVGIKDNQLVLNPIEPDMNVSELDLDVVSTKEKALMIEAEAMQVSQEKVLEAIELAHKSNQELNKFQEDIISKIGAEKRAFDDTKDEELYKDIESNYTSVIEGLFGIKDKLERQAKIDVAVEEVKEKYKDDEIKDRDRMAEDCFELIFKKVHRAKVLATGVRIDGRSLTDVRDISAEVGILPRVHGTGLFNRGYTQVLNIATLGSAAMKMLIDGMEGDEDKTYMHYYNFPPFSTGETGRFGGMNRRAIGHGALAEKAIRPVIPSQEDFPYAILLTSEVLSSDGSTSMGATCSSTLSLMDAGVPISAPVSGIAMGLMTGSDGKYNILTDIAGIEDFHGEMDFKITGTEKGITAIQLDVKNDGLTMEMVKETLEKGYDGRMHILGKMLETIDKPRSDLSPYAPRIETIMINPEKIGAVVGSGGKVINGIIDETGVEIDIEQDGRIMIASSDKASLQKAKEIIEQIVEEPEVGKIYDGKVIKIMDFGAFVEIMPGTEGLVHISEIDESRVEKVEDFLKEGQEVKVKLLEIDNLGRLKLSMKKAK